jgi:hypothetical protein
MGQLSCLVDVTHVDRAVRGGRVNLAGQRRVGDLLRDDSRGSEVRGCLGRVVLRHGPRGFNPDQRLAPRIDPGRGQVADQLVSNGRKTCVVAGQRERLDQCLVDLNGQHRIGADGRIAACQRASQPAEAAISRRRPVAPWGRDQLTSVP